MGICESCVFGSSAAAEVLTSNAHASSVYSLSLYIYIILFMFTQLTDINLTPGRGEDIKSSHRFFGGIDGRIKGCIIEILIINPLVGRMDS